MGTTSCAQNVGVLRIVRSKKKQVFDMQIKSGKKHVLLLQELSRKRLSKTQVGSQALHGKAEPCPAQHTLDGHKDEV